MIKVTFICDDLDEGDFDILCDGITELGGFDVEVEELDDDAISKHVGGGPKRGLDE